MKKNKKNYKAFWRNLIDLLFSLHVWNRRHEEKYRMWCLPSIPFSLSGIPDQFLQLELTSDKNHVFGHEIDWLTP